MLNIKLEKFEGPLGLLLKLIEKDELDITQVSLARVADQFIEYLGRNKDIPPEEMADFLVVASKLLLIKSKALLPYLYPEEEEEIEDFERQLKMYQEFVAAAKAIQKMLGKKNFMFGREFNRQAILKNVNFFAPPKNLEAQAMTAVMREIIERIRPPLDMEEGEMEDEKYKIEDKISDVRRFLLDRIKTTFNRVLRQASSKTEIIVSFLAILELMRQREIMLEQDDLFGEIQISKY